MAEASNRWEVALIGRNLTDKFYWTGGQQFSGTGVATGTPIADTYAVLNRGREIMIRLTVAFGQ